MKGVIIAGGPGTRLRPLTYLRPKPIVPVVNKPFLEYQVELLRRHGISEIIFCTNYMAEMIQAHFGDGSAFGVKMRYAIEEVPLGTAGAVKNAEEFFEDDTLLIFNGDVLTDFDLGAVSDFHRKSGARITLTLYRVASPSPYGVIITDEAGKVREFREPSEEQKRKLAQGIVEQEGTELINAGMYVLDSTVFRDVPSDTPYSFERQLFPSFAAADKGIYATEATGYWLDIGRPVQYLEAHRALLSGDVKADIAGERSPGGWFQAGDATIGSNVMIEPTVHLGHRVQLQANVELKGCTSVGSGCSIEEGSVLEDCVVLDNVSIGKSVHLNGCIIDSDVFIEDNVAISARAVLASGSRIGFGTRIVGNSERPA